MAPTTRSAEKGFVKYQSESTFGDTTQTSFGTRMPVLGRVDLSGLVRPKIAREVTTQYRNEMGLPIPAPRGGSFTVELWVVGHGTAATGAVTHTEFVNLFALLMGAKATPPNGTTVSAATDADTFTVAASGTYSPHNIGWVGVRGDGRGGGSPIVVATHSTNTIQGKTTLPAAPQNGDVFYSGSNVYAIEADDAVTSTRWQLATANQVINAWGCYPTAISWTTENGMPMRLRGTMAVSYWDEVGSITFPTTDALAENLVPPDCAIGSVFLQPHGTTGVADPTAAVRPNARSVSLQWTPFYAPLHAPGLANADQQIGAVVRTAPPRTGMPELLVTITEDAEAQAAAPVIAGYHRGESTFYHSLIDLTNAAAGKHVSLYLSKCCFVDPFTLQMVDANNLNMQQYTLAAYTNDGGASALERAAWVAAFG